MVTVLPALHDDVIVLTGYTGRDMQVHLNGANGHKGHRFGRRPKTTAPATIGIRQAEAHIPADNHASRRVAEKAGLLSVTAFTAEDGTGMVQYLINLANSTY